MTVLDPEGIDAPRPPILGAWHNLPGANDLHCMTVSCGWFARNLSDAQALRMGRAHVQRTRHAVSRIRRRYQSIHPNLGARS